MNKTEVIGMWTGENFALILSILVLKNPNLKIKKQGKKLILKDPSIDFYACVPAGDEIEIPVYENVVDDDDYGIVETEQHVCECCQSVISEEQIQRLKEWGLWKEETE